MSLFAFRLTTAVAYGNGTQSAWGIIYIVKSKCRKCFSTYYTTLRINSLTIKLKQTVSMIECSR